ncbi:MAG: hypothetical protein QGG36_11680 [Pirellulaceae bacterium]|jgi:hypothetical protein|nr:hypothetical protein [Pirellulaceae bacterium]MDP7016454.1 hypothetical protein [Pirellulaceae bacterium]
MSKTQDTKPQLQGFSAASAHELEMALAESDGVFEIDARTRQARYSPQVHALLDLIHPDDELGCTLDALFDRLHPEDADVRTVFSECRAIVSASVPSAQSQRRIRLVSRPRGSRPER